jgi:hypothetical protein
MIAHNSTCVLSSCASYRSARMVTSIRFHAKNRRSVQEVGNVNSILSTSLAYAQRLPA